jgi:hypothetical protein
MSSEDLVCGKYGCEPISRKSKSSFEDELDEDLSDEPSKKDSL